jgi:hypothetical protein
MLCLQRGPATPGSWPSRRRLSRSAR